MKYYEINEELAKQTKSMYSFRDYIDGTETTNYQHEVDRAVSLVHKVPGMRKEKANYYLDLFARKLAQNTNDLNSVELRCPSVMIAGAGNFNIKKKEKQNIARDRLFKERERIYAYLEKIHYLQGEPIISEKQGIASEIDFTNGFFTVAQNEEQNRIQLFFNDKPNEDIRNILKKSGWRWSGRNGCWQRQLTDNAKANIKLIINKIQQL